MAFDFPASPTEGQVFTPVGGPSYVYNNPVWKAVGQGQIAVVSDTAPANPANGQLWWESDTGILFLWYNDGNSSQWVQVGGIAATGAMVRTVVTSSGTYTKPAGLQFLEVELAGGGGGGGSAGTTGAGTYSAGGGGGGAGYVRYLYPAADLAATTAYAVGSSGVTAAAGGNTTFRNLTGGGGGGGLSGVASSTISATGTGSGGSSSSTETGQALLIFGANGGAGLVVYPVAGWNQRGAGGGSFLAPWFMPSPTGTAAGVAGRSYGGGGSGACNGASQGVGAAGLGATGIIILTEYF
jgi:hypothetical protein